MRGLVSVRATVAATLGINCLCSAPFRADLVERNSVGARYGSHMRWHAATGLGIIVLANGRYADAQRIGKLAHRQLLEQNSILPSPDRLVQRLIEAWRALCITAC